MGAIEVSLSNPDIVYAGTGSSKIRSNVSIGRGIYKSTDAGKTWTFAGLRDTGQISTIRVNPTNPDLVYVAALGNPFVPNKERGVYRSTDGGKTWKQVLFLSDTLGAADLELQPGNPKVIFACMWHGQRKPWTIVSGALEGGIYKSTDGGDNWTKLVGGLPHELFGRSQRGDFGGQAGAHLRAHRGQARLRPVPLRRLRRHLDAGQRIGRHHHASFLLRHPGRGPQQSRRRLHRRRRLVQEHRWRQDRAPRPGAPRRSSRHLDQSQELGLHDPIQRWRRECVARWRPHLEHAERINPPRRSTRWPWTINILILFMARSRTTPP